MTTYGQGRQRWQGEMPTSTEGRTQTDATAPHLAGSHAPDPLYGPDTLEALDFDPVTSLGFPGEPPYTRGIQPTMYRGRFWTMRQYAGFGTAAESNARYRYLLAQGQTGLSVAFDLPTQMGKDPDDTLSKGEVGRVGVSIASIEDMRELLAELPLASVSTSMTINATAAILLCLYIAVAEENGTPASALRGTIQNDILKEYIARGTYIFPPRPSLRLVNDVFAFCADALPKWNTISISGYHMREAGCDAIQEVAFTLSDAISYVQSAVDHGLDVDRFGAQLSFFFNVHNNLIEEVAKFRAARRLWADIMASRFGAKSNRAKALRFHCQTAGMTLTAQQPHANIVRVTVQALAAVLGGCQSLHTNGFDEALGLPTEESATLALRTQQVIAHESGVAGFVDALGGSYAVEALTHRIEAEARRYIQKIDELGGMVAAIEKGFPQREIENTAYAYQTQVERQERVIVGQNRYVKDSPPVPVMTIDPEVESRQVARVKRLRETRDGKAHGEALSRLKNAAAGADNLLPLILDAVKAKATVGEISNTLREVWGEYRGR